MSDPVAPTESTPTQAEPPKEEKKEGEKEEVAKEQKKDEEEEEEVHVVPAVSDFFYSFYCWRLTLPKP